MQSAAAVILALLFCAPPAVGATARADAVLNPVTRVVQLLQDLSKKIIADGKAEEDAYEKFVCWGDSVIASKTATNAAAQARIDELEAYIESVKAGKVEFTTERVDLEISIAGMTSDIATAKAQREKEKEDYLAAKDMIEKAIKALQKALQVLQEATSLSQTGSLLALRQQLNEGGEQKAEESAALDQAIQLGRQFLTKADAEFLRRLLTGDVPVVDWKKLNRKAVFKMHYKARSFKIQDVLVNLLKTFDASLIAADAKEVKAEELWIKLNVSMNGQLETSQTALQEMAGEGAAAGMSEEGAQEEVDALKVQVDTDLQFIKQTKPLLAEKKLEWKQRQTLRAEELAAIAKAISTLHSDEARDSFKKSFASQGYLLLQEGSGAAAALRQRAKNAADVIRATTVKVGDRRLLALAVQIALKEGGHFDKVLEAIAKMIATLKDEGEEDLHKKESCEKTRAEKARAVTLDSRSIDEITDVIKKLVAEVNEIKAEIDEKVKANTPLQEEMQKAAEIRESEHLLWVASDEDDKAAAHLIEEAQGVLQSFYADNNLVLAQRRAAPVVEVGLAPPPPPATWEQPYAASEGGMGIVAILSMIKDDVVKDMHAAAAAEDKANQGYLTFMDASKTAIAELDAEITALKATEAAKAAEVEEDQKTRFSDKGSLDAIMKTLKDLVPSCDYFQVNFRRRAQNRALEIDGLVKARGILEGAAFAPASGAPVHPTPSSALLLLQGRS